MVVFRECYQLRRRGEPAVEDENEFVTLRPGIQLASKGVIDGNQIVSTFNYRDNNRDESRVPGGNLSRRIRGGIQ